jgi:hypothetical protein
MGTKNNWNAGLYLCATLAGTYLKITKTHGFKISFTTNFSDDTSHGDRVDSNTVGSQAFKATLMAWYDATRTILEGMAYNKVSEYFLAYVDVADTPNYYRGQCYVGLDDHDLDRGNTSDQSYSLVIANADFQIVRGGAAL